MSLNIKSQKAHRMARALAEARGTSLTEAVTSALEASLAAEAEIAPPELLLAGVAEIQRFVADLPDRDRRTADEILGYDESGLPG